jgi:hypothetical protein
LIEITRKFDLVRRRVLDQLIDGSQLSGARELGGSPNIQSGLTQSPRNCIQSQRETTSDLPPFHHFSAATCSLVLLTFFLFASLILLFAQFLSCMHTNDKFRNSLRVEHAVAQKTGLIDRFFFRATSHSEAINDLVVKLLSFVLRLERSSADV